MTLRAVYFILVMVLFAAIAVGQTRYPYKVKRVIDGDTVEIEANYLPVELRDHLNLRIQGIDTPEKGGNAKCVGEALKAMKAKFFLAQEIQAAKVVEITLSKWDKYGGRVLGEIYLDGIPASKKMLESGLAKPYNGGKKESWCK
jgi:endonuclease YncB( thermonuclease family)